MANGQSLNDTRSIQELEDCLEASVIARQALETHEATFSRHSAWVAYIEIIVSFNDVERHLKELLDYKKSGG